jgi:4-amino-4-deoxy-L-arabinose transferase-like glycosyltransferase
MESLLANQRFVLILILALSVTPYFIKLGESSLWDANEAFYAETPREMIEAGDFINPSFNFKPRFNKPPLCYWVVAGFYKVFGVSESAERLALAFGAIVMMITAFYLGRAAYSTEAGLLAAIALASTPRFLMFSRRIIIDVYIAMFMGLTLLFFLLAEKAANRRKLFLVLMYISTGLGIMTKGPVAAALPAIAFLVYLTATRQLKRITQMMLPAGAALIAAIVLPWYWAIYSQHGWLYIKTFLIQDNLSRYTQPVWGPRRGIFFYLPVLAGDLFPWSLFLFFAIFAASIPAIRNLVRRLRNKNQQPVTRDYESTLPLNRQTLILLIWIVVIVFFYSLSSNKEDLYISPVYTAAAAVIGVLLARFLFTKGAPQTGLSWLTFAIGVLIALIGAAVFYTFGHAAPVYRLGGATAIGLLATLSGLAILAASLLKKFFAAIAAMAIGFVALNFVFVFQTLPDFERYKPVRALCEIITAKADQDSMVGYYRIASPSMVFYLRRQIFEYYQPEELREALGSDKTVYCILSGEEYEALKSSLPVETRILASRPVFQVKLRSIFDRRELPQVVLISNKPTE